VVAGSEKIKFGDDSARRSHQRVPRRSGRSDLRRTNRPESSGPVFSVCPRAVFLSATGAYDSDPLTDDWSAIMASS
jgi:hypothetical protein